MHKDLIDQALAARDRALDAARPGAVAVRRIAGQLTARERIGALCDVDSFVEYGVQARPSVGSDQAAADGVVVGIGLIDGLPVVVASYDHTAMHGTQGKIATAKVERLLLIASHRKWPFICFAEGEGARHPRANFEAGLWTGGQSPMGIIDGLAEMSGQTPTIAVVAGRAIDGHAAIAMESEFCVCTAGSALGAGRASLSVETHETMGDVDRVMASEAEAINAVRQYLGYFRYDLPSGERSSTADSVREIVPDNRRRAYDMRRIIAALADADSVFELRPNWGTSMVTALARFGGRAVGVFGNQPTSKLAGAIDADAADKMARFIELCSAYGLPLISLIDSPGFHIGPDAERGGIARHHVRTLSAIENRRVPLYCLQLRKSYGLGPLVMRGSGGKLPPELRVAWPTVETGGMSLEGAAYLMKRKEIQAASTPEEAKAIRDDYANSLREKNSGLRAGENFSFDEVIDPAATRDLFIRMLRLTSRPHNHPHPPYLDTI